MPGAFQNNAFQNSSFQVAPGISNIVNTSVLPNPLDAALGHYYEPTYKAVARNPDYVAPVTIYSGPDIPTAYVAGWQMFTNLTNAQVAWFMAQPQWADYVATQPVADFGNIDGASKEARR